MKTPADFWDGIARKYASMPVRNQAAYDKTLDRIRAHLSPGDTVMEIGCGTGTTALLLADCVAAYTATDISAEMIAIAREKLQEAPVGNLTFEQMDLMASEVPEASQDVVLASSFLHLMEDPAAALNKAAAMLKPGGLLVTKTICLGGGFTIWPVVIKAMQLVGKAPYVNSLSTSDLDTMIERAGFDILETGDYPAKPASHFVVARKRQ